MTPWLTTRSEICTTRLWPGNTKSYCHRNDCLSGNWSKREENSRGLPAKRNRRQSLRPLNRGVVSLLLRREPDLVQHIRIALQIGATRRKLIRLQNERQNIRILLPAQRARMIARHRNPNPLKKISHRLAVPFLPEILTAQPRHLATAR